MQIDGFTFVAQIFNFLLLVGLLRYFLYDPIINAMDEREKRVTSRLKEAEKKRNQAEQEKESYQQKLRDIDDKREQILSEAREEASKRRRQLFDAARQEVDERRTEWQVALQREKDAFLKRLRRRVGEQAITVARRMLSELADTQLEQQMVDNFVRRIATREEAEHKAIVEALSEENREIAVHSAFELPEEARERIVTAVHEHISEQADLNFHTESELICGIALRMDSHQIGWNLEQYLEALEGDLVRMLEEQMPEGESSAEKEQQARQGREEAETA